MTIVIPCFNEATRLQQSGIQKLVEQGYKLVLVDDGSTDETLKVLTKLESQFRANVKVLKLAKNYGKGEAVRRGLCLAIEDSAAAVGFIDADFATPAEEMIRLCQIGQSSDFAVVMGSRVKILGSDIQRRAIRHYPGRVFATFASLVLDLPVYDTQCGAKFFEVNSALREALSQPFHSAWAFDVELIGRLLSSSHPIAASSFLEVPLRRWSDVAGSKVSFISIVKVHFELVSIWLNLKRRRVG